MHSAHSMETCVDTRDALRAANAQLRGRVGISPVLRSELKTINSGKFSFKLRATVSRPVRLGVGPFGAHDKTLIFFVWKLLSDERTGL
jgi:hypothetical protein